MRSWEARIPLMRQGYHRDLLAGVEALRQTRIVYPPQESIFRALELISFPKVKVAILGQDPYHGPGQANGLAFSVHCGVRLPPSLRNIFKEIESDVYRGKAQDFSTDLERWAQQGVLLLNATLTVEEGDPGSHQKLGWEQLTDEIVECLSSGREHLVFMLWGAYARSKKTLVDTQKHLILEAVHPSPLSASRGFFGCRHFSKANRYLRRHKLAPIQW